MELNIYMDRPKLWPVCTFINELPGLMKVICSSISRHVSGPRAAKSLAITRDSGNQSIRAEISAGTNWIKSLEQHGNKSWCNLLIKLHVPCSSNNFLTRDSPERPAQSWIGKGIRPTSLRILSFEADRVKFPMLVGCFWWDFSISLRAAGARPFDPWPDQRLAQESRTQ